MSINFDISAVTIFIFLIGPAYVFIQSFNVGIQAAIYLKSKYRLSSSHMEPESPHKNILSYLLYPITLAITVWFISSICSISNEELLVESIQDIINPVWLIRYARFTGFLSFISILFGLIYGFLLLPVWNASGFLKNDNKQEIENKQIIDEKPIEQDFCKCCGKPTKSSHDT